MGGITRGMDFWQALNDFHKERGHPMREYPELRAVFANNPTAGNVIDNVQIKNKHVYLPFDETRKRFEPGGRLTSLRKIRNVGRKTEMLVLDFCETLATKLGKDSEPTGQAYSEDDPENLVMPVRTGEIETKFREALVLERIRKGLDRNRRG
ncbi:MAG: hypothetical protein JWM68_2071 [Verrucomicrobiales bacterium]|nr:hypothetical protein [Verrucomicrobiales bacterium]